MVLRTPAEWCELRGVRVKDPDGWRGAGGRSWEDPISLEEFERRVAVSTASYERR